MSGVFILKMFLAGCMGVATAQAKHRQKWTMRKYLFILYVGVASMSTFLDLLMGEFGVR